MGGFADRFWIHPYGFESRSGRAGMTADFKRMDSTRRWQFRGRRGNVTPTSGIISPALTSLSKMT